MQIFAIFEAMKKGHKILVLVGIAMAFALAIIAARHFINTAFDAAEDAGAAKVTNEALQTTIERTEKANDAENTLRNDPDAAHAGCMQHSRTPENC